MNSELPIIPYVRRGAGLPDLTGSVFIRLTVEGYVGKIDKKNHYWKCKCECGETIITLGFSLTSGNTKSCGCLLSEQTRRRMTTHGGYKSPEYCSWASMIRRCTNPNFIQWKDYGGRGIAVCARWMKFGNFISDIGKRPTKSHTLDRIDNNKGYFKENCRWATRKEQSNNRDVTVRITAFGVTRPLVDWSQDSGIKRDTIRSRLRSGWDSESSISLPLGSCNPKGRTSSV